MYGDMIYVEDGQRGRPVAQLPHDKMAGRNEAWLRDMLFDHPELLPITAIDPSFGPLIPLCKEMKIGSGRADLVYINRDGLLTIVECKLWNNPEARRKVVGQILDYGSTVFEWSYSDLEREVRHATQIRRSEHVVYDQVAAHHATLEQAHFVDAVSAALKRGRFLLLVAGNGIRSEVTKIHALFERNLGSGFAFGLVEVGLYPLSDNSLIVQPRVSMNSAISFPNSATRWSGPADASAFGSAVASVCVGGATSVSVARRMSSNSFAISGASSIACSIGQAEWTTDAVQKTMVRTVCRSSSVSRE